MNGGSRNPAYGRGSGLRGVLGRALLATGDKLKIAVRDHLDERRPFHLKHTGETVKFSLAAVDVLSVNAECDTDSRGLGLSCFLVHASSIAGREI